MKNKQLVFLLICSVICNTIVAQINTSGYKGGDNEFKSYIFSTLNKNTDLWHGTDQFFLLKIKFTKNNISQITFSGSADSLLKENIELALFSLKGKWNRDKTLPDILVLPFLFLAKDFTSETKNKRMMITGYQGKIEEINAPIKNCTLFSVFSVISYPDQK